MLFLSRGATFLLFFLLAAFLLLFPSLALGSSVIINEIAWMGTENSSNDEWMELYNGSDAPVSLENWTIKSLTGSLKINLKGIIPSKGFYLLERSDDDTIPSLKADLVYTGALKNTGEIIELRSNLVNPADIVDCSAGWPAGNNGTKQTMERIGEKEWQSSRDPGGTPKQINSTTTKVLEKEELPHEYPSKIMMSEILPSPEGPDSEKEWIEILNQEDYEADLSGWKISDSTGSIKTFIFPEGAKVAQNGYLVLFRPETGIVLNNEGDGLKLLNPNGDLVDSVSFGRATIGESYARTGSLWSWSSLSTPGKENKIVARVVAVSEKKQSDEAKKESTTSEKLLASVSNPIEEIKDEKGHRSLLIYLFALTISIFSGIVILTLKKKVKQLN